MWPKFWNPPKNRTKDTHMQQQAQGSEAEPGSQPISDPLFLGHKQNGIGLIGDTEIIRTQSTGRKVLFATVYFGANESHRCFIPRTIYTYYVLRNGLGEDEESEAHNIASMIGREAQVRWKHHARPLNIGEQGPPIIVSPEVIQIK